MGLGHRLDSRRKDKSKDFVFYFEVLEFSVVLYMT